MLRDMPITWLGVVAIAAGLVASTILVAYLVKKPVLTIGVKLWLLLGLGVLPVTTAVTSTVAGMHATTARQFCGSCHVMDTHFRDSANAASQSLAARHSRNAFFGDNSCYVCHADYGMYGYAMTKAGGMRHVYEYYLGGYAQMSLEEFTRVIHLRKPYDNLNCRQCHTTTVSDWRSVPDHESLKNELVKNQVSCASAGCHGYAHPFTKTARESANRASTLPSGRPISSAKPARSGP
jgi:cytochrome c-type protein NapC